MTPSTFEIKIVQKQATLPPVTTVIGTGTSATRANFLIVMPSYLDPMKAVGVTNLPPHAPQATK